MILFWFIAFIASFLCLIAASNLIARESEAFAQAYGITVLSVGFLLVSISTSLPELAISTVSAIMHGNRLTLGNTLGANITDLLLISGILALLGRLKISREQFKNLSYYLALTSFLSLSLLLLGQMNWVTGIGFVLAYSIFYYNSAKERKSKGKAMSRRDAIYFLIGLVGLAISSVFVVISIEHIDAYFNLSEVYIGALLVSIGTSLPELSVGLAAIKRKNYQLAIGDLIGGCMFDLGFVLGTSSIINPIAYSLSEVLPLVAFLNIANILFILLWRNLRLSRLSGVIMLSAYAVFVLFSARFLVVG